MIGIRDIAFVSLVSGGIIALGVNLIPPSEPKSITSYNPQAYQVREHQQVVHDVNAVFEKHWQEQAIQPADAATDLLIARRLALGLMGTVPSLEEIRQLETLPPAERLPWWTDHILQDRRFADFFAERFLRAFVGSDEGPFILYRGNRFRTWIADQFAKNRPYDAIVRDLIAGQGLWTDHPATNFITATSLPMKENQPDPVRLAGRVTRAFLGLRIDCAQCHNHPFASWKQSDFEGLSAFFGQTEVGFTGVQDGKKEYRIEDKQKNEVVVEPSVPFQPELLPQKGTRREKLATWITSPKNPYFARATVNRVWALMTGRALVEPVDNLESEGAAEMLEGAPKLGAEVLKILADDFAQHGYDMKRLIRQIATTRAFRVESRAEFEITDAHEEIWAVFPLTRLRPEQVAGSMLQAASISTINADSHIISRLMKFSQQNDFIKRYGDNLDEELEPRGGTIPQRLLMMNGELVRERIDVMPLNATLRISWMAPNDSKAVELAYLAVFARRPTEPEAQHFERFLQDKSIKHAQRVQDLFWALVNSTEFSWNH